MMAELLFGEATPEGCHAAYTMLAYSGRTHFKQATKSPPIFEARSINDIAALRSQLEMQEKVGVASILNVLGTRFSVAA